MSRIAALAPLFLLLSSLSAACASSPPTAATTASGALAPRGGAAVDDEPSDAPHDAPTAPSGNGFPRDEARTALRAAEGGLHSCNDGAAPRSLDVTLRFEPSGKVSDVDVAPADDRAAACVRARLSDVSVVPYEGEPVTLRVSVTL
ncbi:MAG: hypothetical protein KIS78_23395 [Labilithrix sp.]|nr:hypothetical protein [Labilithrix sp.]MCW5835366.1 hypothetical protein [Labilithrix sp.]